MGQSLESNEKVEHQERRNKLKDDKNWWAWWIRQTPVRGVPSEFSVGWGEWMVIGKQEKKGDIDGMMWNWENPQWVYEVFVFFQCVSSNECLR